MAFIKKVKQEKEYVQIPNETARLCEIRNGGKLSLQAIGLLTDLWSYDQDKWELHKTELYKRFGKNKETSVRSAWDELKENGFILEYKVRKGKTPEYFYALNCEPISAEQKEEIERQLLEEYGEFSGLGFVDLIFRSTKCSLQNHELIKNNIKEKQTKEIKTNKINNQSINPAMLDDLKYKDMLPDIMAIAYKVFSPNIEEDRLMDIYENYFFFKNELTLMDLLKVLRQIKDRSNKEPIKNFNNYLKASLQKYSDELSKRTEMPQIHEIDISEESLWEDAFRGNQTAKNLTEEEIEAKRQAVQEKLNSLRKKE